MKLKIGFISLLFIALGSCKMRYTSIPRSHSFGIGNAMKKHEPTPPRHRIEKAEVADIPDFGPGPGIRVPPPASKYLTGLRSSVSLPIHKKEVQRVEGLFVQDSVAGNDSTDLDRITKKRRAVSIMSTFAAANFLAIWHGGSQLIIALGIIFSMGTLILTMLYFKDRAIKWRYQGSREVPEEYYQVTRIIFVVSLLMAAASFLLFIAGLSSFSDLLFGLSAFFGITSGAFLGVAIIRWFRALFFA